MRASTGRADAFGGGFSPWSSSGTGWTYSRLAVVASRKVGPAVVRNRVKRRFRELFRRNKELLREPLDLIVITRPESGEAALDRAPGRLCLVLDSDLS
ncbi:MAG: ribonuclease P protein component [Anaerotruncus sp.]|nr:ribonuclease P protein component [Anaerotruncus sp.]